MATFYEKFFKMPPAERRWVAEQAGISLPYILKQIYVKARNPVFRFANAVNLDRASGGKLPFYEFSEHASQIDWDYVARRLAQAKRKQQLPALLDGSN